MGVFINEVLGVKISWAFAVRNLVAPPNASDKKRGNPKKVQIFEKKFKIEISTPLL